MKWPNPPQYFGTNSEAEADRRLFITDYDQHKLFDYPESVEFSRRRFPNGTNDDYRNGKPKDAVPSGMAFLSSYQSEDLQKFSQHDKAVVASSLQEPYFQDGDDVNLDPQNGEHKNGTAHSCFRNGDNKLPNGVPESGSGDRDVWCPKFVSYFRDMPPSTFELAVEFAVCYQEFWQQVYVQVFANDDLEPLRQTCKDFWSSVKRFAGLVRYQQFSEICSKVDQVIYTHLADTLTSTSFLGDPAAITGKMREIAQWFPLVIGEGLEAGGIGGQFMEDRVEAVNFFSEILWRRAAFLKSLP